MPDESDETQPTASVAGSETQPISQAPQDTEGVNPLADTQPAPGEANTEPLPTKAPINEVYDGGETQQLPSTTSGEPLFIQSSADLHIPKYSTTGSQETFAKLAAEEPPLPREFPTEPSEPAGPQSDK